MEAKGAAEIRAALQNLLDAYDIHEQTILSFLVDDDAQRSHLYAMARRCSGKPAAWA